MPRPRTSLGLAAVRLRRAAGVGATSDFGCSVNLRRLSPRGVVASAPPGRPKEPGCYCLPRSTRRRRSTPSPPNAADVRGPLCYRPATTASEPPRTRRTWEDLPTLKLCGVLPRRSAEFGPQTKSRFPVTASTLGQNCLTASTTRNASGGSPKCVRSPVRIAWSARSTGASRSIARKAM